MRSAAASSVIPSDARGRLARLERGLELRGRRLVGDELARERRIRVAKDESSRCGRARREEVRDRSAVDSETRG